MTAVETDREQAGTRARRREVPVAVLAAAVFLLSAALRMVNLGRSGDLFVDELIYRQLGVSAGQGQFPRTAEGTFFLHPPGFFDVEAGWGKIVGLGPDLVTGVYHARLLNAALGALTAVLVFLVVTRAGSRAAGVVAALLFAVDPYILRQNDRVMLDTQTMLLVLAGYLLLLTVAREPLPGRPRLRAAGAGLLFGLAVLTKDPAALITVLPLLLAVALGWGPPRRLLLISTAATLVPYGLYMVFVAGFGHLDAFWYAKSHGISRLFGTAQETGFNAPGAPSLAERLVDQTTTYASTYALLALGPVALVLLLRRSRDPVIRMLSLFYVCAGLTLAFALAQGTLEEQALYLLIVPTVVVLGAALAVLTQRSRQRRGTGSATRRRVALTAGAGFLTAVVTFAGVSYVTTRTEPDDGYARLRVYLREHVPPGSAISSVDGGISSWALRDHYRLGTWVTPDSRLFVRARYLVVPWKVVEQGYGSVGAPVTRRLADQGKLVFAVHGRTYGELALYTLPLPHPAPVDRHPPAAAPPEAPRGH